MTEQSTHRSASGAGARHRLPVRTLVAASIGNAVEWYDWTIYVTFSIFFATQIFPKENAALALISTLATYALAFFFRPLGGWLLGRFADLRGRRTAMMLTIVLMAGGSLAIGLLPTFAMIGWLAPVLLLLARIAQGMSLGGEVSNASAYLAEIAPPERRGRYSSFFYISTGSAVLVASLLGALLTAVLTSDELAAWGWRIPFVIGGLLGLVGLWLRRAMPETDQFEENKAKARATAAPAADHAARAPAGRRAAGRLHPAVHALLLHVLLRADPVRGELPRRRPRPGVRRAVHRHRAVRGPAVPDGRPVGPVRAQPAAAGLVGGHGGAHRAAVHADRPGPGQPAGGVLRRARALHGDDVDRAGDHERAVPDRAARPGHRRLVQPDRRAVRRHRAAGHPVAVGGRAGRRVLLVRRRRRRDRLPGHPHPAGDPGAVLR